MLLADFRGEESVKRLFWEVLSFERVRLPLRKTFLPGRLPEQATVFEVLASHDGLCVVYLRIPDRLECSTIERICRRLNREFPDCVLLLREVNTAKWTLVYPDSTKKNYLRLLPLPGLRGSQEQTAKALAALGGFPRDAMGSSFRLDVVEQVEIFFPGELPRSSWRSRDAMKYLERRGTPLRRMRGFLKEIGCFALLTKRQERGEDLFGGERPPDGCALEFQVWRLVMHNLRFVVSLALRMPRIGQEIEDYVQDGAIGLLTAARRFDPALGKRFTTYAYYWVRQVMLRALHRNYNLVQWPDYAFGRLVDSNRGRDVSQLAAGERLVELLNGKEDRLETSDNVIGDLERRLDLEAMKERIGEAMRTLTAAQQEVLALRYGLDGLGERTLEAIGQRLDLCRERIRQIEAEALSAMKGRLSGWLED